MVLSDRWFVSDEQIERVVEALQSGGDKTDRKAQVESKYRIITKNCPQLGQRSPTSVDPSASGQESSSGKSSHQCKVGNIVNLSKLSRHETMQDAHSGRRIRGAETNEIRVYVYVQSTQATVAMWVSPELSVGGESAPEDRQCSGQLAPSTSVGSRPTSKQASKKLQGSSRPSQGPDMQSSSKDRVPEASLFSTKEVPEASQLSTLERPETSASMRRVSMPAAYHKQLSQDLPEEATSRRASMRLPPRSSKTMPLADIDFDSLPPLAALEANPSRSASKESTGINNAKTLQEPADEVGLQADWQMKDWQAEQRKHMILKHILGDSGRSFKERRRNSSSKDSHATKKASKSLVRHGKLDDSRLESSCFDSEAETASWKWNSTAFQVRPVNLQEMLEKMTGIPVSSQKLRLGTSVIAPGDPSTLRQLCINHGSTITLLYSREHEQGMEGARDTLINTLRESAKHNKSSTGAWAMPRWENPRSVDEHSIGENASGLVTGVHMHNYQGLRDVGFVDPCAHIRSGFGRKGSKTAR